MYRAELTKAIDETAVPRSCNPRHSSNQVALNGVCHRLKPIMSPEFFVDVVEMIAQCLRTDTQRLGYTWSIVS